MNPNDAAAFITMVITIGVIVVAVLASRNRKKMTVGSAELAAIDQRLARMEQAIDAMAVETERISEGQRFTTKLLSERIPDSLPRK